MTSTTGRVEEKSPLKVNLNMLMSYMDDTSLGTLLLFDTAPIFDGLLSLLVVPVSLLRSLLLLCVLLVLLVVVDQA